MNAINTLAFRIFGEKILEKEEKFSLLRVKLRQAQIPLPVEQFVSTAILFSLLAGVFGGLSGLLIGALIFRGLTPEIIVSTFGISDRVTRAFDIPAFIGEHLPFIFTIIGALFFFSMIGALTYGLIMAYPSMKSDSRKRAINATMPHATAYLYVMQRGGGMTIFEIMKSISKYPHIYGTTSREFGYIIRDIEYFGKDLQDALWDAADRTPSEQFKDLIDGLISVVSSGGDVTLYLKNKTDVYKANANKEQKHFLETLGLLAEVYITVFVVAPLFLMVILVVMNMIDNGGPTQLYLLVYGVIPFGTMIFLVFLDMLTGDVEKLPKEIISKIKQDSFSDVRVKPVTEKDEELLQKMEFYENVSRVKSVLLHPIRTMRNNPPSVFIISAPIALGYFVSSFVKHMPYYGGFVETASTLDDYVYVTILILFIPYIIFHELEIRRVKQIEDQIPEFLKRLASINGTGILLADAIGITAQSNMGRLKSEIKSTVADIRWNSNLVEALKRFEARVRTNMTRRSLSLIAKASESTGNIHQVISTVADDADIEKSLKKERAAEMFIYVFIIFVTFCVFLIIVYVLAAFFLPALDGSSNPAMSMGGFNLKEYTLLFFHAALLQGFGSGLVAGKMGSGNLSSGLKQSLAMMTVSYLLFIVFI
ncbi:MAG: type II secretion system F family protein [Methanosarcina sp.]|uniref:type II secretion system F family protein n=1 Tax=Methanosarcina sp. TaxID=2213 RepID=UPI00262EA482|nr:type II secretion system F family protein [Methanosarcina sp.]MDD3247720.1 type II secretion system F family protein [Methanosarcina sp.]MDD4248111.1 type II secretion system F family protein [Methanosarcina sp.]